MPSGLKIEICCVIAIIPYNNCLGGQQSLRVADIGSAGQEITYPLGDAKMFITVFRGAHHCTLS
jgi:hypothetical protein